MSFDKLQKLDIAKLPRSAGNPPAMEWISLSKLGIDSDYQRPITARGLKTIGVIASNFKWCRFSPVIVTQVGPNQYAVIDGQHRATAALTQGFDKVPCYVVSVDAKEAASVFHAVNGVVTPMSAQAVFKAARVAGEKWALDVDRVCQKAGLEPLTYPVQRSKQRPRQTMIVGTIANRIRRFGEDCVALALEGAMRAPGAAVPGFMNTNVLDYAILTVNSVPSFKLQSEAIIRALEAANYNVIGRGANETHLSRSRAPATLHIITSEVSKQIKELHERRYPNSAIATTLRIPYDDVEKVLSA